jgi:hypothetical protein
LWKFDKFGELECNVNADQESCVERNCRAGQNGDGLLLPILEVDFRTFKNIKRSKYQYFQNSNVENILEVSKHFKTIKALKKY